MVKYNRLFEDVLDGKNNGKKIRQMISDNGGVLERHPVKGYGEYVYAPSEENPNRCRVVLEATPEDEKFTVETYIEKKDVDFQDPEFNVEDEAMYDRLDDALADLTEQLVENGYEDFRNKLSDGFILNRVDWEWIIRIAEAVLYARNPFLPTRVKNTVDTWLNW